MRLLVFIAFIAAVTGCDYKNMKDAGNSIEGQGGVLDPSKATFATVSTYIFKPRCNTCHNPVALKGDIDLTTYQALMDSFPARVVPGRPEDSDIYISVRNGDMPSGAPALSGAELEYLRAWILNGAVEK